MPAEQVEQKPWQKRRLIKEAAIRSAAVREFSRHGYGGASIQPIADSLGINKATLYHYVDSKEQLLSRILDYAHGEMIRIQREIATLRVAPVARLRAFLERHLVWYLNNLELAKVTYHEWINLSGGPLESERERRRNFDAYVRGLIRDAQADGSLRTNFSITLAANFILGAINAVPSWYKRRGSKTPDELGRIFADFAIAMIETHPNSGVIAPPRTRSTARSSSGAAVAERLQGRR